MRSGKILFPDKKGKSPQPLFTKKRSIDVLLFTETLIGLGVARRLAPLNREGS